MSITLKARAKLNLNLNVEGMYNDKYHSLRSVIVTVDVFDLVQLSARTDEQIIVTVDGIADERNVANKVAAAICSKYNLCGVDINVQKGIAIMGGMGGSSVDAAATIMGLSILHYLPLDDQMLKIASQFGSDIAYMLRGGLAVASGKGDDIKFVQNANTLYFTVINGPRLSTTDVFAQYDSLPDHTCHDVEALLQCLADNNIVGARKHLGNNLQASAVRLNPAINDIFTACAKLNLPTPTMTGSGGNFFILQKTLHEAQKAASKLNAEGLSAYATCSADDGIIHA